MLHAKALLGNPDDGHSQSSFPRSRRASARAWRRSSPMPAIAGTTRRRRRRSRFTLRARNVVCPPPSSAPSGAGPPSNPYQATSRTNTAWVATTSPEAAVMPQTRFRRRGLQLQAPVPLDQHFVALGSAQPSTETYSPQKSFSPDDRRSSWTTYSLESYGCPSQRFPGAGRIATRPRILIADGKSTTGNRGNPMRKLLLIIGFLALAIGLLWIGRGPVRSAGRNRVS